MPRPARRARPRRCCARAAMISMRRPVAASSRRAPISGSRAVRSLEGKPFFATVRGQCITSLYDNDMAFTALGYPGSSWEKGGYITRGFQDLKWLPEPSGRGEPPSWTSVDRARAGRTHRGHGAAPRRRRRRRQRRQNVAKFDLNDDSVVIIIGSGAGGGTLCNEPARRASRSSCSKREGPSSGQLHQRRMEVGSANSPGSTTGPRPAPGAWPGLLRSLPARVCKTVGGTTTHWAGASLRFAGARIPGLDPLRGDQGHEPDGLAADAGANSSPTTVRRRGQDGREVDPRHPGPARQQQLPRALRRRLAGLGYKEVHTGNMAINSQARDDRGRCLQLGFCFQGCKSGGQVGAPSTPNCRKAEKTGNLELRSGSAM